MMAFSADLIFTAIRPAAGSLLDERDAKTFIASIVLATLVFFLSSDLSPTDATELYVDPSVAESGDGSVERPFQKIQEGIDAAEHGDSVVVAQGTYYENIHFNGKNISLQSSEPLDSDVVAGTIIDGNEAGPVVTFGGTEDETCVLSGFTIRNGWAEEGGGICGGTWGTPTHATIENNRISGNAAIRWHFRNGVGGGLVYCDGTIRHNTIFGNSALTQYGGGLAYCHGRIESNTICGNSANLSGGGLAHCRGTIVNCIIWGNRGRGQLYSCTPPAYCCIQGWTDGGSGNIAYFPHLVDADNGDFHLKTWSPCTDAGDPSLPFSDEPEPNGDRIDMGSYGHTPEATSKSPDADGDGLPDDWETEFFRGLSGGASDDPDGDSISNMEEYHRGLNPTTPPSLWYVKASATIPGDGTSWGTAFKRIQEAIEIAHDADTIVVGQGIYIENIHFNGRNITLRSTDPVDPDIVASTIIDGNRAGSVVTLSGTEDETCVLSGFTLRNGKYWSGGGVCGGDMENETHATIQNNVISRNSAPGSYGGGLYYCCGVIRNNTISQNSAGDGGGLYHCDAMIYNNVIAGNAATSKGGGLVHCHGTIQNNIVSENSARNGGGLCSCVGMICSNVIAGNVATWQGGGLSSCYGKIRNNTISGNSAGLAGGGLYECTGVIQNCIIWGNSDDQAYYESWDAVDFTYCCIQGWTQGGEGNTAADPRFVDVDGADDDPDTYEDNDYRLAVDSPCKDAGINEDWMQDAVDLDGNPRIWGAAVEMGAYEYGSFPFKLTEVAADADGTQLTWNSRPGDSYTIQSCTDLSGGQWNEEETIASQGDSTNWTDSDTACPCKFYRIELK